MLKKIGYGILAVLLVILAVNYKLIPYAWMQAKGQLSIVWDAEPISDFLSDPDYPEEKKEKLRLVEAAKRFAVDSLGLAKTGSYRKMYDEEKYGLRMWVLTACEPYALKPKRWKFPLLGSFGYKGFFNKDEAIKEGKALKAKGYDTGLRTAGAWSTLGWLDDPVMSNMLDDSDGDLAETIIHELTHATLYVPDSTVFNENLANFIGYQGAIRFLNVYYGPDSPQLTEYLNLRKDRKRFKSFVLRGAQGLDSLYKSFGTDMPTTEKAEKKDAYIDAFTKSIDTVNFANKKRYAAYFNKYKPNNTFFMSYRRYNARSREFDKIFKDRYHNDIRYFLDAMKERYPAL
ncbi:hypothetical protein FUAX_05880 [Fulvitalea axinellae]|uniref:Aminopeptidase n=1 Tax=Fulvitalea axinellae TaxID=1182444 RepID=A0AAU9D5T0_9BACT|nr:hypothetical protein FUAX_05880 [Fulvitalea axinellae]